MYDFWTEHLQKDVNLRVDKALTDQTDGFLPILFAASAPSSATNALTAASDVDMRKGLTGCYDPFASIIRNGGGRIGWSVVFENTDYVPSRNDGCAVHGKVCDLKLFNPRKGESTLEFLPCGCASEILFENSDVKKKIDGHKDATYIPSEWSFPRTRVPLGTVLEYVEKRATVSDKTLKVEITYDGDTFIEDLEAFLPKAGKPNRPWKLYVKIPKADYDDYDAIPREDLIRDAEGINQTVLRYKVVAQKDEDKKDCVRITLKKKELSERADNGTLTLVEEDVAGKALPEIFKELNGLNEAKGGKAPAAKIKNIVLPFKSGLYRNPWKNAMKDVLKEAVVTLLKGGLNADWSTLTLDLKEAFDAKAFEKDVNEALEAANVQKSVTVSPEGVITFVPRMPMPPFENVLKDVRTRYNERRNAIRLSMEVLKWTDEWTKWFERPETDFGKFIEALAEHPEICCVDFSSMPKDSVGHRKYITEDAVKQLPKVSDVWFVCRYYADGTDASKDIWEQRAQACALEFLKKGAAIATWRHVSDANNAIEKDDGGWLQVRSNSYYVVSKPESGKRRLLWNIASLRNILEVFDEQKAAVLEAFSGKRENLDLKNGDKVLGFDNLENKGENGQPLVPYEPIDRIDFTIGDPKVSFKIKDTKHKWEDVHAIVGKKTFWDAIGKSTGVQREHIGCVSMLAYEDCLTDEAKEAAGQAGWIIKARGKKGERNVVEIKYSGVKNFRSGFERGLREIDGAFGSKKHANAPQKRTGALLGFEKAFDVPQAEGVKWVKADTKDNTALSVNSQAKKEYEELPFDTFMDIVKKSNKHISKLDLTKFDDEGEKVSLEEFLKHPMRSFTVPLSRLTEIENGEKAGSLRILAKTNTAVTFLVFPRLQLKKTTDPKNGRAERYLANQAEVSEFAKQYFTEFTQQLGKCVKKLKPDVVSMTKVYTPEKLLEDAAKFKEFFDSEDFSGVGFEFSKNTDFKEAVETYDQDKNFKNTLAWLPETNGTLPAVYVLPKRLDRPANADASKTWLDAKKGKETISRLQKLKAGLKEEAELILGEDLKEAFSEAVDALTGDGWQIVIGIEIESGTVGIVEMENGKPKSLFNPTRSILLGADCDFALRLCNGFPLSAKEREMFKPFVKWAQEFSDDNLYTNSKASVIAAVLRFFLSYPDMELPNEFCTSSRQHEIRISKEWQESWNFTFGQLMKKYKDQILWKNKSFKAVKHKDTNQNVGEEDYQKITENWEKKNSTFRSVSDRKNLEKRFGEFLKSLRGFDDWDTEGGTIKDWEDYQLKRLEVYKDLTKKDEDLPKSLTTREEIRDAEKK